MTTITEHELDCARQIAEQVPDADGYIRALLKALGITIADPKPPEAMVKLAREIAAKEGSWTKGHEQAILDGRVDDHYAVKIALAALQFADKVVREAPCVPVVGAPIVHKDAIRRKLGAIA